MSFGLPEIRVGQTEKEIVVKINISGIDKKDIRLKVREDFLRVNIEKKFKSEKHEEGFFENEWKSRSFSGEVVLPCKIIPSLPNYSYNGDVLEIRLKKA